MRVKITKPIAAYKIFILTSEVGTLLVGKQPVWPGALGFVGWSVEWWLIATPDT